MSTLVRCLSTSVRILLFLLTIAVASAADLEAAGTPPYVEITVGLRWRDPAALETLIRDLADPQSGRFRQYLSPDEFVAQFAPTRETVEAASGILAQQGLQVTTVSPSRLFLKAAGQVSDIDHARAVLLEQLRNLVSEERLYFQLFSSDGDGGGVAAGDTSSDLHPPEEDPPLPPQSPGIYRPADIARLYGFDQLYARGIRGTADRSSTIAIATAFGFDRADLETFWLEAGIERNGAPVELIWVGASSTENHAETTADVEWASSLSPASPILVYAAPDTTADSFLQVYDRAVQDNRAAVLTTSWGACERRLSNTYLEQAHIIFQRAAAQGITVIAASGDNGADDCRDGTPGVNYPASDPNVLATGGTTADGIAESAWSGSGGGMSDKWRAAPWQMHPALNRVLADVAFHADPARGFAVRLGGQKMVFGGTSLAAPSWAALLALVNQVRAQKQLPTLGIAAAGLCEIARYRSDPAPFIDIVSGGNGNYTAGPGWDFPTGWGSPRAALIADMLSYLPAPLGLQDLKHSLLLTPAWADSGAVRLQLLHRCGAMQTRVTARGLEAGRYDLTIDGETSASFDVDGAGDAAVALAGVDPRDREVSIRRDGRQKAFSALVTREPVATAYLNAALENTGVIPAARGKIGYRRSPTRQRLVIHTRGLPPGNYLVHLGAAPVAWVTVPEGRDHARVRFDSTGRNGEPLRGNPLCDSITLTIGGESILRLDPVDAGCS